MEEHDENLKRPRNVYVEADESVVSNEGSDLSPASSRPSMDDAVGNITSALKSLLSEDEDDTRGPEELVDCIADMTCVLVSGTKQQPGQQRSAMVHLASLLLAMNRFDDVLSVLDQVDAWITEELYLGPVLHARAGVLEASGKPLTLAAAEFGRA